MSTERILPALLALVLTATASAAQAAPHRRHDAATSAGGYQVDERPWSFACIKDHGPQRCNDVN